MKTTYFKPSIHGWPFGNSFTYSIIFGSITLDHVGFCGGMCWRALNHFYNATPIPRDTPTPSPGDPLYDEIRSAQEESLPASTLFKISRWQESPDLGHWNRGHSLGHMTLEEWPKVKSRLDNSQPVTLTLIASTNDVNALHLSNNHRVVAYAYDERALLDGEDAPTGANTLVSISIYDPNSVNDDDVLLTFFLGGEDSNIRIRHNRGTVHGFFLDDKDRSYAFADSTAVRIRKCEQTGISSANWARYDLVFDWQCRVIPYFRVNIDGSPWNYNNGPYDDDPPANAKSSFPPADKNDKQCAGRTGSATVSLRLPRRLSTVGIRLLDSEEYCISLEIDAHPAIECYPYVHGPGTESGGDDLPRVRDASDGDLFIRDPNPSQAAVQQLDTSPFRWIEIASRRVDARGAHGGLAGGLARTCIQCVDSYRLGNLAVPILASFKERNLVASSRSGVLTIKVGQSVETRELGPLASQAQRIFDGFTSNPGDYDHDKAVELTYTATDRFGVTVNGQVQFYGKSIVYQQIITMYDVIDPSKLALLEAGARKLTEWGLIDALIELPGPSVTTRSPVLPGPFPGPQPRPIVPADLVGRLGADQQLQRLIEQTLRALWSDVGVWREIWTVQSAMLKQTDVGEAVGVKDSANGRKRLEAAAEREAVEQRRYDSVILGVLAGRAIEQLCRIPTVMDRLKSL
jgi:hypothetical protein